MNRIRTDGPASALQTSACPTAARFLAPIGLEHFFDAFFPEPHATAESGCSCCTIQLPLDDVSDTLVVKQDRAELYRLTPVWAPVEPPAKRAKTAEVRLSSTGDVSMTPKKEENEQGSSDEEDSVALTLTLAVKMIHLMFLIWTSSKKHIQISVVSRLAWTHLPWSVVAQVIQTMMSLDLTCLEG